MQTTCSWLLIPFAGPIPSPPVPPAVQQHLDELVAAAAVVRDMPALASPHDMLMASTSLQNTFTCHFQQRNLHGRIFGGFLLRRAFELAFATCFTFAGARPVFDCIDDVQVRGCVARLPAWSLWLRKARVTQHAWLTSVGLHQPGVRHLQTTSCTAVNAIHSRLHTTSKTASFAVQEAG